MERDFLGMSGKDSMAKEDARGACKDGAFLGSSSVQWPFSNKISALQQFMSFKAAHDERPTKIVYDQRSSSSFQPISTADAFDNIRKSSPVLVSQKSFGADRQGVHQFSVPAYISQGTESFGVSAHQSNEGRMFPAVSHHSIPIATSSPFFKVHGSANGLNQAVSPLKQQLPFCGGTAVATPVVGTTAGAFAPRNITKPSSTTAQLTIFFAGAVNVYDDVSLEKAQAIMFLAGNGSNMAANAGSVRAEAPVFAPTKVAGVEAINMKQTQSQTNGAPPCSGNSSPISVTSQSVSQSVSGSSITDDMRGGKTISPLVPTGHHEPLKTVTTAVGSASGAAVMPRAVPQARKASLARFLEKRKERVTSVAPYASSEKPPESTNGFDGINLSANSMTAEVALSSGREQSWCLGTPKTSTDSSKSLNTKLEM